MAHDVKSQLTELLQKALASVAPTATDTAIHLERPRDPTHGDFATNLAMQLAKALKKNPREIAGQLLAELPVSALVARAEIAGAGFINFTLDARAKIDVVGAVLVDGENYGRSQLGGAQTVQIEFVSANPTGPLHVGHGRGAAYGASLSSLLAFAGWDVTREYYVNDAGRQMDILGLSTWLRYLEQHGERVNWRALPAQRLPGRLRARHGAADDGGAWRQVRSSGRCRARRHARPAGSRRAPTTRPSSSASCISMR